MRLRDATGRSSAGSGQLPDHRWKATASARRASTILSPALRRVTAPGDRALTPSLQSDRRRREGTRTGGVRDQAANVSRGYGALSLQRLDRAADLGRAAFHGVIASSAEARPGHASGLAPA
jgi:hypothetical protein